MQLFALFSILISLAALFSYINVRFLKLPAGISLMLMGLLVSLILISTGLFSDSFTDMIRMSLETIDFSTFILGIVLSFLLFAGSLHVHIGDIRSSAKSIVSFATIGTIISTFVIGTAVYYMLRFTNVEISFVACLLFGSLISPTDPVAVLSILSKEKISKSIEIKIVGESLFNDGIGVVVFATLLTILSAGVENVGITKVSLLFLQEAVGGIVAGWVIGYAGFRLMKSVDDFPTEILITLAMVMGGSTICSYLHVSGPLAMVVAGLFTGNWGRQEAMSDITMDYLGKFWEVVDHILNAVLFMLIGLELVVVNIRLNHVWIGLVIAIALIVARYISLYLPSRIFRFKSGLEKGTLAIMTWGGLRGAISIALALSLPATAHKEIFVPITFVVVLFSIVVQGLSVRNLVKYFSR